MKNSIAAIILCTIGILQGMDKEVCYNARDLKANQENTPPNSPYNRRKVNEYTKDFRLFLDQQRSALEKDPAYWRFRKEPLRQLWMIEEKK